MSEKDVPNGSVHDQASLFIIDHIWLVLTTIQQNIQTSKTCIFSPVQRDEYNENLLFLSHETDKYTHTHANRK